MTELLQTWAASSSSADTLHESLMRTLRGEVTREYRHDTESHVIVASPSSFSLKAVGSGHRARYPLAPNGIETSSSGIVRQLHRPGSRTLLY